MDSHCIFIHELNLKPSETGTSQNYFLASQCPFNPLQSYLQSLQVYFKALRYQGKRQKGKGKSKK